MNLKELVEHLEHEKPAFQRRTFKNIVNRYARKGRLSPENLPEDMGQEYEKATYRKKVFLWLEYGDPEQNNVLYG